MSSRYKGSVLSATAATNSQSAAVGIWRPNEVMQAVNASLWPFGISYDPYFDYVSLLLHGDGTNGAQNNTFIDSSTNNFTITRNGNTTQGSFSPYGVNWSNLFTASTTDALVNTTTALVSTTATTFTAEAWVFLSATPANASFPSMGTVVTLDGQKSGAAVYMSFGITTSNTISFYWYDGAGKYCTGTSTVVLNSWNHIAVSISSNTIKLFLNGVSETLSGTTTLTTRVGTATTFTVGGNNYSTTPGFISNVRVTTTAVYTSNFTPSTTPLTAITGTVLLTSQSNKFVDNSSNAYALTTSGSPKVQRFTPFAPPAAYSTSVIGASGYFDGTGDYLSIADNVALKMGSSDFTYECWLYPTSIPNTYHSFISKRTAAGYAGVLLALKSTGKYSILVASNSSTWGVFDETTISVTLNTWQHFAVVRSGSSFYVYLNGTRLISTSIAFSVYDDTSAQCIGVGDTSAIQPYVGYISDVRIVKGTALYTGATFTLPATPLTAVTNTSLLLNYTNAGIYDNAMMNNLETVGDAQVSTSVVKFDTGSMAFDGTGDWLTAIDTPNLQMGSGNFTIEGWIYLNAIGVAYGVISKGTASTGISVNVTSGNKLQFSYTASNLTGATSLAASTWYYFAVVRSGTATGNLKIYLNGSVDATSGGAVTDNFNQTSILYVGASRTGTTSLNGYIDDLRVTKGYARTITTPTAAFPNQ